MFWKKKNVAPKMPEPTPEQLKEEQEMAARNEGPKRTVSGETTKIINITLSGLDEAIKKKQEVRQSAKKLKDSINEMTSPLTLKKV